MRHWAWIWVLVWGAALAEADAPSAMKPLLEKGRVWKFGLATGASWKVLKPISHPGAHVIVEEVRDVGKRKLVVLRVRVDDPVPVALRGLMTMWLVVDEQGVHEVPSGMDDEAGIADRDNAFEYTFPPNLKGTWKFEVKPGKGNRSSLVIKVKAQKAKLGKKSIPVWIGESLLTTPPPDPMRVRKLHAYAPGVGPYLICADAAEDAGNPSWACLMLSDAK